MKSLPQTRPQDPSTERTLAQIFALDLEQIKAKLMHPDEGYGWTREQADHSEIEYKRYLALLAKYPDETIVPSKIADKFWHGHILDTMKYADDCQRIFGYFLHHYPYFGLRGEEDAANQEIAADTMRRLYELEFGGQSAEDAAYCGRKEAAAYCGKSASEDAAYCGKSASEDAAYCGKISAKDAAYCGRVTAKDAAYCGVASASYCGRAADQATAQAAYCGKAPARQEAAYCGKAAVSYCGKADSVK